MHHNFGEYLNKVLCGVRSSQQELSKTLAAIRHSRTPWTSLKKTMAPGSGDGRSSRSESFIREYHVYQRIWIPELGKVTVAVLEDNNTHDRYGVTKVRDLRIASFSMIERFFLIVRHSYLMMQI